MRATRRRPPLLTLCAAAALCLGSGSTRAAEATPPAPLVAANGAGGLVTVTQGAATLLVWRPHLNARERGALEARRVVIEGRDVLEVRVQARDVASSRRAEAWVGELPAGGRATPLWAGPLGPLDADGESFLELRVTPAGIVLAERAPRIAGCDGTPALLLPRRWSFAERRFVPVAPADVAPPSPPGSPVEAHRAARPPGSAAPLFRFASASAAAGAARARDLGAPAELADGRAQTSWHVGAVRLAPGALVVARGGDPAYPVRGLVILPGDARSPEALARSPRLRRIRITFGPGQPPPVDAALIEDADGGAARFNVPFWIPLPKPVPAACVSVAVMEAEPAQAAPDAPVAVAELAVVTALDETDAPSRLASDIAAGGACGRRADLLTAAGAAAWSPALDALPRATEAGRMCLLDVLDRLGTPPAPLTTVLAERAAAALRALGPQADEKSQAAAVRLLGRVPREAAIVLQRAADVGPEQRVGVARALAAVARAPSASSSAALETLVTVASAFDSASPQVRPVVAALGAPAVTRVLDRLERTDARADGRNDEQRAELLAVLTQGVRATRPEDQGELRARALAVATREAEAQRPFLLRGRAVALLGALGDTESVAALSRLRAQDADAVVRRLVVLALADARAATASEALIAALTDRDPGVRETAARALARAPALPRQAPDTRALGTALLAQVRRDPWPFARAAEVRALGVACPPGAPALLLASLQDGAFEVRRAAVAALPPCPSPNAAKVLFAVLARRAESPALRTEAAQALAAMNAKALAPAMLERLPTILVESQAELALEETAAALLEAVATLDPAIGVRGAQVVLQDPRPSLRRGAVEALRERCALPAAQNLLRTATADPDAAVARTAGQIQSQCGTRAGDVAHDAVN